MNSTHLLVVHDPQRGRDAGPHGLPADHHCLAGLPEAAPPRPATTPSGWVGTTIATCCRTPEFWAAVRFTLVFVAVTVPVSMVFGLAVALLLDRIGRGRAFYMAALLLPFIVTPVVGTLIYEDLFERGRTRLLAVGGVHRRRLRGQRFQRQGADPGPVHLVRHALRHDHLLRGAADAAGGAGRGRGPRRGRLLAEPLARDAARTFGCWSCSWGLSRSWTPTASTTACSCGTGNRFTEAHTLSVYNVRVATRLRHRPAGQGQRHRGAHRHRHLRGAHDRSCGGATRDQIAERT